jgi:hypothetical protein
MCYVIDPTKNSNRSNSNTYGVLPGSGVTVESRTKFYTINQDFTVKLMKCYRNRNNDHAAQEAGVELYAVMDDIFKVLYLSKVGGNNFVLVVESFSFGEVEYFEEENTALLEATFVIKYTKRALYDPAFLLTEDDCLVLNEEGCRIRLESAS